MQIGLVFSDNKKATDGNEGRIYGDLIDIWKLDKNVMFQETSCKWYASRHI
jgi:hypothetical protein